MKARHGMTRQVHTGTVIAGTLRNEDLLNAFTGEVEYLMAGYLDQSIEQAYYDAKDCLFRYEANPEVDEGIASEIVNELIDALNEYAPEGMYFGTLEGDGADFGWWYIESEVTA
jgi:hypothetical protein